jgi:hypothetical protein
MPLSWEQPIRQSRQLTIFTAEGAKSSSWAKVLDEAVLQFNKFSVTEKLGVAFAQTSEPPSEDGAGGANVSFNTANGAAAFRAFGQSSSVTVDGNGLLGKTQKIMTQINGELRLSKAFIFVPATPRSSSTGSRVIGDPAKLIIAFHELVHACGLDPDHTPDDVFFGFPSFHNGGSDPNKDRIQVGNTLMPPIIMSADTVKKIRSVW